MYERRKILDRMFITHDQAAKVRQPRIGPLNDPPPLVAAQCAAVLMRGHPIIASLRDNGLNRSLDQQRSGRVAIVAPICIHPLRFGWTATWATAAGEAETVKGRGQECHFRGGCRLHAYAERSTRVICQNHKLCPLTAFGLAHTLAPFLATTNIPSTKHSFQRIFLVSLSWSKNTCHRAKSVPRAAPCVRRRCTALLDPYRLGSSLHGAPVQRIHKMPSKHWRSLRAGRPPRTCRFRFGSSASIRCHCLSVTARHAIGGLLGMESYEFPTPCQSVLGWPLEVFSTETSNVIDSIPVGDGPFAMALVPAR